MRRLFYPLHLYLGLVAGALFVLLGLTGSLLVFYHAIDETLNPLEATSQSSGPPRPLSEMLAAVARVRPHDPPPFRILMPRHAAGVVEVWAAIPEEDGGGYRVTTVDPASAAVLGTRDWGGSLATFVYRLHATLFLGEAGKTAVGVIGLLVLMSIITGIVLWWPKTAQFSQAFTIQFGMRGYRRYIELHKALGLYTGLVLLVIAFSGVSIVFPRQVKALVEAILPVAETPTPPESSVLSGALPIGPDRAVSVARRVFPAATLKRVVLPGGPRGAYVVSLRQRGEVQESYGQSSSSVAVDQYSGEVLAVRDYHRLPAGDRFLAWLFPLHNGEALGQTGRWTVFVAGFVPLVLYVTGLALWWAKRKARRRN
ncbi:MAG: PepSY domain-containing protein [Alphaproteobacteria bacterium]|nr:PepSY domain-containing protein [Alphaproteobacteria bacterium]